MHMASVQTDRPAQWLATLSLLTTLAVSGPAKADDPVPARKVDVGGHKLTLVTRGSGGPTVVIEPGMGHAAVEGNEWKSVCDEIARTNLVCLYDRAGLGSSDPAPKKPRTSRDAARDLHTLLKNAKIPGPYVLVAHSIGGLNARVFADMYPDDVAGVVLVDVYVPDIDAKWLASLGAESPNEDAGVKRARQFLKARIANRGENPDALDLVASREQAIAAGKLGSRPLAVLTHSPTWKMVPDLPDDVLKRIEQISQELQAELPKLSTNSSHKVAAKAGHAIHVEDPKLVIDAIREVVRKVKDVRKK